MATLVRHTEEEIIRQATLQDIEDEAEAIENELVLAQEDNDEFDESIPSAPDAYNDPNVELPLVLLRNVTEAAKGVVVEKTSIAYERCVPHFSFQS